jgi:hypothetical protein
MTGVKSFIVQGPGQCVQIGRNLDIWASLGYFLLNKFSNTQAVFNTWFVGDNLRFQKWFDVNVLAFPIKL